MSLFLAKPLLLLVLFFTILVSFSNNAHAAALQKPPTNLGLVGYWSFNEGTSTVVTDFSGNNNHGTTTNIAHPANATSGWMNGKRGKALSFDGGNDLVRVPTKPSITDLGPMTISAWIKPRSLGGGSLGKIVVKDTALSTGYWQFFVCTNASVDTLCFSTVYGTQTLNAFAAGPALKYGEWQHVAMTWDGSQTATNVHLYINGVETTYQTQTNGSGASQSDSALDLIIGNRGDGTRAFDGLIDEVRVYNRVLSNSELITVYSAGQLTRPTPNETGLVSYWSLNEATSTVTTDFSNNGNTGTLTASTGWTNAGKFGPAVTFGETVQMTTTNQYSNPTVFTISAWFNSTSPSGKKIIGFESNQTGNSSASYDRHLYLGSDGKVYFGWFPGFVSTVSSTGTYADGMWHHVVGTHDGTTGTLYVDGVSQGSSAAGAPQSYSGYWRVGGRKLNTWTNGSDGNFTGKIDDVRIYNKTLSASEVASLFSGSKTRFINSSQVTRLKNGLVGLWTFDGRDVDWGKNIIYDRSGNNLYGTTTGLSTTTTPVSGKVGQAFRFWNTANNYIDLGNNALLAPTSAMTVSAWINTNNCNTSRYILSKGDAVSYYFRIQAATCKLRFQTTTSGSGTVTLDSANNAIQNNVWHHVAGTWDGSNMRLYVDGTLSAGPTAQTGTLATPGTNVQIGAGTTLNQSWDGALDEIRLYNRALDASEIKQLYLMGK